jgi:3-hydroxy-9,10-secoandrosta-1,3,5(10)-triene-9,17-dione monooxygenase reductase component
VLVCFDNEARTLPIVRTSERFGVNVLAGGQQELSRVFASKLPEREKFAGVGYTVHDGVPILDGALAWLLCRVEELIPGGDHTIAIGSVLDMHHDEGDPLVWYRGAYTTLG